jgi:hypothetical protein
MDKKSCPTTGLMIVFSWTFIKNDRQDVDCRTATCLVKNIANERCDILIIVGGKNKIFFQPTYP